MMGDEVQKDQFMEMHAIVYGYVQGVGFRATASRFAKRLDVVGTVKNLPEGTVEIYAQSSRGCLEQLVEDLKSYPRAGDVERVDVEFYSPKKKFNDFDVIF